MDLGSGDCRVSREDLVDVKCNAKASDVSSNTNIPISHDRSDTECRDKAASSADVNITPITPSDPSTPHDGDKEAQTDATEAYERHSEHSDSSPSPTSSRPVLQHFPLSVDGSRVQPIPVVTQTDFVVAAARSAWIFVSTLYAIAAYLLWFGGLLLPLRFAAPALYWRMEAQIFRFLQSPVAHWMMTAGYTG